MISMALQSRAALFDDACVEEGDGLGKGEAQAGGETRKSCSESRVSSRKEMRTLGTIV